jgi:uncharacterized protein (TIGR02444 family)
MTVDEFWDWALARYSHPATREHLLALQDRLELVVLEALFAAWLANQHYGWSDSAVDRLVMATESWHQAVVLPLRDKRIQWRSEPSLRTAREHLLSLEVQAERHLAELIWDAVMSSPESETDVISQPASASEALMSTNLGCIAPFRDGKYVSERAQTVALLDQAT